MYQRMKARCLRVLVSCKVSNSVLVYFEKMGIDLTFMVEQVKVPDEFLRDPSYWLQADEMEEFLKLTCQRYIELGHPGDPLEIVGQNTPELRSWGVLDSVLKMMPKPIEILKNPSRFLSYFLSPEPTVSQMRLEHGAISFQLDLQFENHPLVQQFLKSAFEALPLFQGSQAATVIWSGRDFRATWVDLKVNDSDLKELDESQLSSQLIESVVDSLQTEQLALEQIGKEISEQNRKYADLDLFKLEKHVMQMQGQFLRFRDYFNRALQLVTLISGMSKNQPAIREIMRRLDWQKILGETPELATKLSSGFDSLLTLIEEVSLESSREAFPQVGFDLLQSLKSSLEKSFRHAQRIDRTKIEIVLMDIDCANPEFRVVAAESSLQQFFFDVFRISLDRLADGDRLKVILDAKSSGRVTVAFQWTVSTDLAQEEQLIFSHVERLAANWGVRGEVFYDKNYPAVLLEFLPEQEPEQHQLPASSATQNVRDPDSVLPH